MSTRVATTISAVSPHNGYVSASTTVKPASSRRSSRTKIGRQSAYRGNASWRRSYASYRPGVAFGQRDDPEPAVVPKHSPPLPKDGRQRRRVEQFERETREYRVERVAVERRSLGVTPDEGDPVRDVRLRDSLSGDVAHPAGAVESDDATVRSDTVSERDERSSRSNPTSSTQSPVSAFRRLIP